MFFVDAPYAANEFTLVQHLSESRAEYKLIGLSDSIPDMIPGRLRISDVNQDGYPDIIMTA